MVLMGSGLRFSLIFLLSGGEGRGGEKRKMGKKREEKKGKIYIRQIHNHCVPSNDQLYFRRGGGKRGYLWEGEGERKGGGRRGNLTCMCIHGRGLYFCHPKMW